MSTWPAKFDRRYKCIHNICRLRTLLICSGLLYGCVARAETTSPPLNRKQTNETKKNRQNLWKLADYMQPEYIGRPNQSASLSILNIIRTKNITFMWNKNSMRERKREPEKKIIQDRNRNDRTKWLENTPLPHALRAIKTCLISTLA